MDLHGKGSCAACRSQTHHEGHDSLRILILGLQGDDRLCRCISAAGMDVTAFLAKRVDLGDFGHIVEAEPDFDMPYRLRSGPVWPLRPYPYSRWTCGLAHPIQRAGPQVVLYTGEPSELAGAQSLLMVRRLVPDARLGVYVFENIAREWRGKLRWLRGRAERAVLAQLDFAACSSQGAVGRLVSLGLPQQRCRVVYPEVDAQLFQPADATATRQALGLDDAVVIGYVGRIVWEKGLDVLAEAFAGLSQQYRLLLVGSGDYLPKLQAQMQSLGIAERVRHVPSVPLEQVPRHMSAMDMMVLPSRSIPTWQEQYGRVLVQAMLCQIPVIGSDCGAIPEVIGEAGLVFPEGSSDALCDAMRWLGEEAHLRQSIGHKGYDRAIQTFVNTYRNSMVPWLKEAADMPLRNPSSGRREMSEP